MISFEQFLVDMNSTRVTAKNGIVIAQSQGQTVYTGRYVVGDYDDKLQETLRAYKRLVEYLLEQANPPAPEVLSQREANFKKLMEAQKPKVEDPNAKA